MKNNIKISYISGGMFLMAFALSFAVGISPAQAQAATYYGSNYSCARPFVYPNGYYYCPSPATVVQPQPQPIYQPPVYQQPIYQQPVYPNLTATCYPTNISAQVGMTVQWVANASGGIGSYSYSWSGTDSFTGSGQSVYKTYYTPGVKNGSVTIYSGSQSIFVNCNQSVNVNDPYYYQQPTYIQPTYIQQPIYQQPSYISSNYSGLDIGCYADPSTAVVNQPVTWNVEVTGGALPYSYSWTGTDGLSGSQASVIKYYGTAGTKSAIVSVTSADGKTGTHACSTALTVRSARTVAPTVVAPVAPVLPDNSQAGAAIFSLNNVPWGWVAVLVILVLFATVMYLLFNRTKM